MKLNSHQKSDGEPKEDCRFGSTICSVMVGENTPSHQSTLNNVSHGGANGKQVAARECRESRE